MFGAQYKESNGRQNNLLNTEWISHILRTKFSSKTLPLLLTVWLGWRAGTALVTLPTLLGTGPAHWAALFQNIQLNWISWGEFCQPESSLYLLHKLSLPLLGWGVDLVSGPTKNCPWHIVMVMVGDIKNKRNEGVRIPRKVNDTINVFHLGKASV